MLQGCDPRNNEDIANISTQARNHLGNTGYGFCQSWKARLSLEAFILMAPLEVQFDIANPSSYHRTDYVQVDLDRLVNPDGSNQLPDLDENKLTLYPLYRSGRGNPIPYQIDYPLGREGGRRVLTFLASDTPPAKEDYSQASSSFCLIESEPSQTPTPADLWVGYYHQNPKPDEPPDGFSTEWDQNRALNGVKLVNGTIEAYFSLVPGLTSASKKGALTSVVNHEAYRHTYSGEMLSPYWKDENAFLGTDNGISFLSATMGA